VIFLHLFCEDVTQPVVESVLLDVYEAEVILGFHLFLVEVFEFCFAVGFFVVVGLFSHSDIYRLMLVPFVLL